MGLALLLNQKLAGRSFYRAIIFSPTFTTGAAVALVWSGFSTRILACCVCR